MNNASNIQVAFEMLREELEAEIDAAQEDASESGTARTGARPLQRKEHIDGYLGLLDEVDALQKKWAAIQPVEPVAPTTTEASQISHSTHWAARTPQSAFHEPILEALCVLGGSASAGMVLTFVYVKMKSRLTPFDYELLVSGRKEARWRNSARWARKDLVLDGRMERTDHGIWTISPRGRRHLEVIKGQPSLFD